MSKQLAAGAGITVGATLLMGGAAQAATLTVGSTDDTTGATDCAVATNTDCTLRDAIEDANATPASTIVFASAISGDTITLGGTELPQITAYSTTIQGPSGGITVDGANTSRIFHVSANGATISRLTIQKGSADYGGGIRVQAGQLTLSHVSVSDNTSTDGGGGVAVHTGTLNVDSSTISGNTAGQFGGGIYGESHTATGGAGTISIANSTISGNTAGFYGGGVYFDYRSADSVKNSTIYDNTAGTDGGGLYHFGGIEAGERLVVTGSTITHNDADRGGGIASAGESEEALQPLIRDSIISTNAAPAGPDVSASSGTLEADFSLIGAPDTATIIDRTGPNLTGEDPQLGPLGDNGGPTETQKPAATSPVVDAGSAFGLIGDQRGQGRPFDAITANAAGGDGSDIGAVELQVSDIAAAPPPTTPVTPVTPATPITKKKCKKKKHKSSAQSAKKKGCKKKKKKR
jgi:predicted outer membrane repeat protein